MISCEFLLFNNTHLHLYSACLPLQTGVFYVASTYRVISSYFEIILSIYINLNINVQNRPIRLQKKSIKYQDWCISEMLERLRECVCVYLFLSPDVFVPLRACHTWMCAPPKVCLCARRHSSILEELLLASEKH